jgi:hypothetical protein
LPPPSVPEKAQESISVKEHKIIPIGAVCRKHHSPPQQTSPGAQRAATAAGETESCEKRKRQKVKQKGGLRACASWVQALQPRAIVRSLATRTGPYGPTLWRQSHQKTNHISNPPLTGKKACFTRPRAFSNLNMFRFEQSICFESKSNEETRACASWVQA